MADSPSHFARYQNRLSDGSDISTPGMTECSSCSESDVSFDDDQRLYAEQARNKLWDSYFDNRKTYTGFNTYSGSTSYSTTSPRDRCHTTPGRRASPASSKISSPRPKFKRPPLAGPLLHPEYSSTTIYSPFPSTLSPVSTSNRSPPSDLQNTHKSWPLRNESRTARSALQVSIGNRSRPSTRPHAHTSPSAADIQRVRIQAPASLILCTMSRDASSSYDSALRIRSTPSSPTFAPQDLMDGMGSYLDIDDEEDDDGNAKGVLGGLVGRLRNRTGSCGATGDGTGHGEEGKGLKESWRKISCEFREAMRMRK